MGNNDDNVLVAEIVETHGDYKRSMIDYKPIRELNSTDKQMEDLSKVIQEGEIDKESTRKKVAKLLKAGDPLVESRATMVIIARKEMDKMLRVMDSIDRLETKLIDRIINGYYDDAQDFQIYEVLRRLESTMARSLTIIEKVNNNPAYEEFLLAFRDIDSKNSDKMDNLAKVASNKDSRVKIREILLKIKNN